MTFRTFLLPAIFAAWSAAAAASVAPAEAFAHDVRPILQKNCFDCHGEKKQKAGLRLDRKAGFFAPADDGKIPIAAGKAAESELLKRVLSTDDDVKMPPDGERVSAADIAILRAWIDAGAVIPDDGSTATRKHWAYVKPLSQPLPEVKLQKWCRNGIDAFVLSRLEREGLKPALKAGKAELLRRVSLDLTGLPPALAEVDAFLADNSADAYEKAVDRLLASPAYGERWARPWLDLARYADTQGYEKDNRRSMWPYRDWVIEALNRDLPFDQFTVEQLAGDMLPNATQEQRVATGFHRNTMTNTEGGTDDEEFRYEAVVDRVNTTFGAWMGTTLNCAQCHNHKYDPFTNKEYYQVMAFLNNTEDSDKDDERPTMKVVTAAQREELAKLRVVEQMAARKLGDASNDPAVAKGLAEWEKGANASMKVWTPLHPDEFKATSGAKLELAKDDSILASENVPDRETYELKGAIPANMEGGRVAALRLELLTDKSLGSMGPGRQGNAILTEIKISSGGKALKVKAARADFQQDGWPVAAAFDGKSETGWAFAPQFGKPHQAVFVLETPLAIAGENAPLEIVLEQQNPQWAKHVIGKFRLSVSSNADASLNDALPKDVLDALAVTIEKRNDAQRGKIREHYLMTVAALKPLREAAQNAKNAADTLEKNQPLTSVMVELPKARATHRHVRGAYLSPAEEVQPGTPAALHSFPKDQPLNRLGFARWLVDRNNPLTARVIVNRFWEQYFGKGIVETVEEFGKQGEPPSHPELLDWLAVQFMEGHVAEGSADSSRAARRPWSMKALHRLIVTSATYRQSSVLTPELRDKDPFNRLLARGPRVRLEAEMLRDQALAVSGLLSKKMGGPSVMPPQPPGIWQMVYSGDQWATSPGEDKYRRGIYTFWRRTSPHPMFVSFDAPSREFCVLRRNRSDTPLQALDLLNDPQFLECAQALAQKIASVPGDTKARATLALRTCLARTPRAGEAERLVQLYETQVASFAKDPKAAASMAFSEIGTPKEATNAAERAAWTVVLNVIMNLDEMITKG